jgi:hypothetical protein
MTTACHRRASKAEPVIRVVSTGWFPAPGQPNNGDLTRGHGPVRSLRRCTMDPAETSIRPDLEAVRQRRITLRVSTENLKNALAAVFADPTARSCADVLSPALELQRCLAMHIEATEGSDGFHSEMLAAAPRLAHDVAVLVREHSQLALMLSDLVSRSAQESTPPAASGARGPTGRRRAHRPGCSETRPRSFSAAGLWPAGAVASARLRRCLGPKPRAVSRFH